MVTDCFEKFYAIMYTVFAAEEDLNFIKECGRGLSRHEPSIAFA
jgi:hypothetical protein